MRYQSQPLGTRTRHWLACLILAVTTACGSDSTSSNEPAAAVQAAAPAAQAAPPVPAPAAAPATEPAAAPAGVQESAGGEAADGGEQLKLASAASAGAPTWRFQEGQDFKVLTAAQGTGSAPDKIEVAEAFWYGCPHCYQFDPLVSDWAAKLPSDITFVRLPVMWNPTNQIHARVYYTALALGKAEEMHAAIFRELHVNGQELTKEADIETFFGKFGVSAADFQKTFRSFAVEGQLKRARELTERYQVRSVPIVIVNGKYTTEAPGVKNFRDIIAVSNELIERERQR